MLRPLGVGRPRCPLHLNPPLAVTYKYTTVFITVLLDTNTNISRNILCCKNIEPTYYLSQQCSCVAASANDNPVQQTDVFALTDRVVYSKMPCG